MKVMTYSVSETAKVKIGQDKEKVKCQHTQQGSQDGGSAAQIERRNHHDQQIHHDQVDGCDAAADQEIPCTVATTTSSKLKKYVQTGLCSCNGLSSGRKGWLVGAGHNVDIDVPAFMDQIDPPGSRERTPASAGAGVCPR